MAKSKRGRKKARQLAEYKPKSELPARAEPQEVDNEPEIEPEVIPENEPETKSKNELGTKPVTTPKTKDTVQPDQGPVVKKLDNTRLWSQVVAGSQPHPILYPYEAEKFLEESRKNVPLFLFRASWPDSGSGIEIAAEDGNVKMVPRAFLERGSTGVHASIYQIPNLEYMVGNHLWGHKNTTSEFSSWGGSLRVALGYLFRRDLQARISVIDTRKFPNTGIYHVPNLDSVGLSNDASYSDEYMVHGVVQGGPDSGYRSVLWTELVATGVDRVIEWYQPQLPLPIHIIRLAKKVVSSFGPELIVPVTAALLSCKFHESEEDWIPAHTEEEVAVVRAILFESTQIKVENFLGVDEIMENIVYTVDFDCIKQSILLLRQLTEQTHGKDATALDYSAMSRFVQSEATQFWASRTF